MPFATSLSRTGLSYFSAALLRSIVLPGFTCTLLIQVSGLSVSWAAAGIAIVTGAVAATHAKRAL